jgi:hypothetical protein
LISKNKRQPTLFFFFFFERIRHENQEQERRREKRRMGYQSQTIALTSSRATLEARIAEIIQTASGRTSPKFGGHRMRCPIAAASLTS